MTRRDFNLIADVICRLPPQASRDAIARAFAVALPATNPNFNWDRFLRACEPEAPPQTPIRRKRVSP